MAGARQRRPGADWTQWRYGRTNTSTLPRMSIPQFSLPAMERAGGCNTVNATGANYTRGTVDKRSAHQLTITPKRGRPSPEAGRVSVRGSARALRILC